VERPYLAGSNRPDNCYQLPGPVNKQILLRKIAYYYSDDVKGKGSGTLRIPCDLTLKTISTAPTKSEGNVGLVFLFTYRILRERLGNSCPGFIETYRIEGEFVRVSSPLTEW
jgi:hypothetical protein